MKNKIKKIITFTTILGGSMFAANKLIDYLSCCYDLRLNKSKKKGEEQSDFTYQWKNGTIFFQRKGKGTPLLLIHDLNPISSSYEWSHVIEYLSKSHTVYTIDLLGCGKSDKPCFTYVNYLYVQLINDFIQNVIHEKTDLIVTGESFSFAVMAARMNHENIGKITAINPTDIYYNVQSPTKMSEFLMHTIHLPIIGTFIYNMTISRKLINRQINKKFYFNSARVPHYLSDMYYKAAHLGKSEGKHLYASIVGKYTNINIIHALKLIDNPIHFIITDAIKKDIEEYKKYNPDIAIDHISNAGYLPQLEKPKDVALLIMK